MTQDRRANDVKQCGVGAAIKRFCSGKLAQAVITALLIAFVLYASDVLTTMPSRYVVKAEIKAVEVKHVADIQRLDDTKLDRKEYETNHESLRREIKENLADLKTESKEQRSILMQILTNQRNSSKERKDHEGY